MTPEQTCCFTGHRPGKLPWGEEEDDPRCLALKARLAELLEDCYRQGYRHFICGMAQGADMYFGEAVLALREEHPDVTLEAAIPCEEQAARWREQDRRRYFSLVERCDYETMVQHRYTHGCMQRRDRYMVDRSGLLIAAKNDFAHQALAEQLQDHSLYREYEAVCVGTLREDAGTVDAPIGRHPTDRKKMAVVANGRNAVTHWTVLERFPGFTYVECRLETGRTHQIRVHMAHIGHPILGDTVYGAKKAVPGLQGQCLHAVGLRFLHPRTGQPVELQCPLPEEFQAQLQKLAAKA